jgi:DNA polymerase III epsilon subunit-like protein
MIIIDIEASGLDVDTYAMVSLGAVDFDNPERQFYAEPRMWDGAQSSEDSLAINGFSDAECRDSNRVPLQRVMHDFLSWIEPIKEKTLVGQNPSYDRDFVNNSFKRSGIGWNFSYRTLDLHTIAYVDHIRRNVSIPREHSRTGINLDYILLYVGIPAEPKPHNALTGAKVEAEALSRMLYGKNLLPEFEKYPIPPIFSNSHLS